MRTPYTCSNRLPSTPPTSLIPTLSNVNGRLHEVIKETNKSENGSLQLLVESQNVTFRIHSRSRARWRHLPLTRPAPQTKFLWIDMPTPSHRAPSHFGRLNRFAKPGKRRSSSRPEISMLPSEQLLGSNLSQVVDAATSDPSTSRRQSPHVSADESESCSTALEQKVHSYSSVSGCNIRDAMRFHQRSGHTSPNCTTFVPRVPQDITLIERNQCQHESQVFCVQCTRDIVHAVHLPAVGSTYQPELPVPLAVSSQNCGISSRSPSVEWLHQHRRP